MSGIKLWRIEARFKHVKDGWEASDGFPTFYLHPDVQAITDGTHACKIARSIVDPLGILYMYASAVLEDMETGLADEASWISYNFEPEKTE